MENNLLKKINGEIDDFKHKQVQIVPGLYFNQWETLQRVFFYYNSKFTNHGATLDPTDDENDRMYFYNIVKNPCKVFSKAIDFDTKHIKLLTTGGGDPLKTWFMERDLKYWMRENKFGLILNRLFRELPIYGSVVLKIVDGMPHFVDLRNFVVEQSADSLEGSNYINEIHNYTVAEFRKVAKQMGWKNVNEVISKFHEMKDVSHIRVYERYGEVEETKENGDKEYSNRRVFIADVGIDEFDQHGELTVHHPGVLLDSRPWEGHPYWEFHAEKMPGRWLGIGVVETLFEPQVRMNELVNLQSKASHWLALHLFYTNDTTFNRNLSLDSKNGEVFQVDSSIQEIVVADRNGAHFNDEHHKWLANRDENTFSYDSVQGQRAPAGTTATEIQSNTAQNLSYFEQIQENVAMDVKEMLYSKIIPNFAKEANKEHTLRLVGQDLDQYTEMIKNDLVMQEIVRMAVRQDLPTPTTEDREALTVAVEEAIKQGKERILDIPKDFYKDVKYNVEIDITGEAVDVRVKAAAKFALLQAMTADPSMLQDPSKRKILASYAEDSGIKFDDFFSSPRSNLDQMLVQGRAGGGVSAPALDSKVPGAMIQTV